MSVGALDSIGVKLSFQAKMRDGPNCNSDPDRRCLEAGKVPFGVNLHPFCTSKASVIPTLCGRVAVRFDDRKHGEVSSKLVSNDSAVGPALVLYDNKWATDTLLRRLMGSMSAAEHSKGEDVVEFERL